MTIYPLDPPLAHHLRVASPSLIVLHATGGSTASGAIDTLREKGFSYHYLIEGPREQDGKVIKCVPASSVAYHAGNSYGPHEEQAHVSSHQDDGSNFVAHCSVNSYSLGVSFVNMDDGVAPYSEAQVDSAAELVKELVAAYPTITAITTHKIVSPGRKTDPTGFDVASFGQRVGLPVWRPS